MKLQNWELRANSSVIIGTRAANQILPSHATPSLLETRWFPIYIWWQYSIATSNKGIFRSQILDATLLKIEFQPPSRIHFETYAIEFDFCSPGIFCSPRKSGMVIAITVTSCLGDVRECGRGPGAKWVIGPRRVWDGDGYVRMTLNCRACCFVPL